MTVSNDVPIIVRSLPARRRILVAAWEEDVVLDPLRFMSEQHGETDQSWLEASVCGAGQGSSTSCRYGA